MSRDFALAWRCPHLTVEEHVQLSTDKQTLPVRQPVATAGTVRIMVNNNERLFIPQNGLATTASLASTLSGPYDLVAGEDDLTVISPSGTQTFGFGVTSVSRFTTDQLIKHLQKNGLTVALAENINGHFTLSDYSKVGPDSYLRVKGGAVRALGFGSTVQGDNRQHGVQGKMLFPSWRLHKRSDEITNRYPKFDYRVQSNPVFKVTYTAPAKRCRRCGGTEVENDYRFDSSGQGLLIENENLLLQACLKILLTIRGSNPFHDWYGSTLTSRIGAKALSGIASIITEDVRRTLSQMQTVQREQGQYQQVTAKERLYAVLQVQTRPHQQDQTTFLVDVVVQNASSEPISLSIVYTAPGVVALMGSNGLFLGTEAVGLNQPQASLVFGTPALLPVK